MTKKRIRAAGLAATLVSIPLLLPNAAGANAGDGYVDSSSDPQSYPPLPGECTAGQLWWQWTGDPNAQALSDTSPYIILDMQVPAGHVSVPEAITWDARKTQDQGNDNDENEDEGDEQVRVAALEQNENEDEGNEAPVAELNESMRVEFYNGTDLIAASPFFTPDLLDDNPYAWSVSDLGTVDLPVDATKVVLAHSSTFMDTDGTPNRFLPKAVCIESVPFTSNPTVTLTHDCDSATLTMTNDGEDWAEFSYGIGDQWTTINLGPGESEVKEIPLVEDEATYVEAWANDTQVVSELIQPDCVLPPAEEPPTDEEVVVEEPEVQVLAETEEAPELAFTGSDTVRNAGIGAAFLAIGGALLGVSRRRRSNES